MAKANSMEAWRFTLYLRLCDHCGNIVLWAQSWYSSVACGYGNGVLGDVRNIFANPELFLRPPRWLRSKRQCVSSAHVLILGLLGLQVLAVLHDVVCVLQDEGDVLLVSNV